MIISRTPVRISFFGGGTDYREYYTKYSGAVLGTTIDKYVYVSINRLSDFFEYKIRVGYSKTELVNSIAKIDHPSVRECIRYMKLDGNLDIHIFADLPARTGLGSSSSFTVGFLNALYALEGRMVSKENLASRATFVEQEMIKENVGSQDQVHAAFGGLNVIRFDKDKVNVTPLIISEEKKKMLEKYTMIFYTGQTRNSSDILKEQVERTKSRRNNVFLKRMQDMVDEAERHISHDRGSDMLENLGRLMHQGWEFKKSLSTQVSNPLIDKAYNAAIKAGAYGGKVAGAGSGGFLVFIVAPKYQPLVRRALKHLLEVDFKFEDEGSKIIYFQ